VETMCTIGGNNWWKHPPSLPAFRLVTEISPSLAISQILG